jgi:hypothetical protein
VIRFGGPGVDLNTVLQSNDQELDSLVLNNFEVDAALELSNVGPTIATIIGLLKRKKKRLITTPNKARVDNITPSVLKIFVLSQDK